MIERVRIAGRLLEARRSAVSEPGMPTLVFLHEALGSLGLWRTFPDALAARTGYAALITSRYGNGFSDALEEPRKPEYLHDEALIALPALLKHYGVTEPIFIGHSDGATIALIAAAQGVRPRAFVAIAPHVFVEEFCLRGVAAARDLYTTTNLRERIARHHTDGDRTFYGWNDIWLAPEFRGWSIVDDLDRIDAPALLVQGANDEYGTLVHLEAIEARSRGPVESLVLQNCGHSPQFEQPEVLVERIARFVLEKA